MIHVFHTSAAELARRRESLARRCLVAVALPGLALCYWALATPVLEFCGDSDCNFTGVAFIPGVEAVDALPAQLRFAVPPPAAPAPAVLATALPEFIALQAEELSMDEPESEPTESELNTPAEALLAAEEAVFAIPAPTREEKKSADTSDAGTYIPPAYLTCPQPSFPAHLRQRRVHGTVRLIIEVSAEGEPTGVTISTSSGHASLDAHAQRWVLQNWRFTPATQGGKALAARVSTAITFALHS